MITEYGKKISKLAIEKGVTLKELAEAAGVSASEVSYMVKGKRKSPNTQEKLMRTIENMSDNCTICDYEKTIRFKLIDADMSVSQLAKQLGISRAAAYYAITNKRGYDKIRERIEEMLA